MANSLTANPLIIDTAATITFGRPLLARRIDWIGAATIGNAVVITDLPGNVRAQGFAPVVNQPVVLWDGSSGRLALKSPFVVSTIQSGKLMIWY
jgi:hypothetical protein